MSFSEKRIYSEALMYCLGGNHCRYLVTIFTWHFFIGRAPKVCHGLNRRSPQRFTESLVYHMMKLPRSWAGSLGMVVR